MVTFRPAVGQLYDPMRQQWPEGASWRLSPRDVELMVALERPTVAEVAAARGELGEARFAFVEQPNALLLCHRLGTTPWSVQPWQAIRQERPEEYPPGLPGGETLVHLYLVDATTGKVKAISAATWPTSFTRALAAAIDRHLAGPQDDAAAETEIQRLLDRYADTARLVRERAEAACHTPLAAAEFL